MSGQAIAFLIDLIAADLRPHLGGNADAADAVATELAGEITSRFSVVPLPGDGEEASARRALADMEIPGLPLFNATTKGRT